MKPALREARKRLKNSTRQEFESLVYNAMLTPTQEHIVRLYVESGASVTEISTRMGYSDSGVRKLLNKVYEKVANL